MLKRSNKLLAVLLAVAFAITTFGSDFSFSYATVLAADEDAANDVVSEDTIATAEWEAVPEEEKKEPIDEGASNNETEATAEDSAATEAQNQEGSTEETVVPEGTPATETTPVTEETPAAEEAAVPGSTIIPEDNVTKDASAASDSASVEEDAATESSSEDAAAESSSVEAASDASSEASSAEKAEKPEKNDASPAQEFKGDSLGVHVEVQAEEGVFPAGTTMVVNAISDTLAVDTAKEALGEDVQQAKGVDIAFYNAEGKEIEPSDSRSVHVSITLSNELSGDSFSVIHKDDAGNTEKVAEASSGGASFDANAFSVYIVAGSGNSSGDTADLRAICTYTFYLRGAEHSVQMVKEGDKLANPGVPQLLSDEEFLGWRTSDGKEVAFGTVGHVEADSKIDVYAIIQTTYYLTYIGVDGEVVYVKKKVFVTGESTKVEVNDITTTPKNDTQTFLGWTLTEGSKDLITDPIDVAIYKTVYAVASNIHWIYFDGNGPGASYTDPVFVYTGDSPKQPAAPTRKGYDFEGWYTKPGNKAGEVKGKLFDWSKVYQDSDTDITLYAKWKPAEEADYTIVIWKQSVDDDYRITSKSQKTYDYYGTTTGLEHMGHKASTKTATSDKNLFNKATLLNEKGFTYSWQEGVRVEDGKTIATKYIRPEEDTIINVYYDRVEMTISFWSKGERYKDENGKAVVFKGLYEQPLSMYGYTWPEGPWVFEDDLHLSDKYDKLNLDFLDSFIFTTYTDKNEFRLYKVKPEGAHTDYHYFYEELDGTYTEDVPHMTSHYGEVGAEFEFYCDDYYKGFKPDHYIQNGVEHAMVAGTKLTGHYTDDDTDDIYLYFHRLSAKIEFMDNFKGNTEKIPDDEVDDVFDSILFDMPLDGSFYSDPAYFSGKVPDLKNNAKYNKPGYEFVGWSETPIGVDASGTSLYKWDEKMPLANKILYAVYKPVTCNVILDPDGGTITSTKIKTYPITMEGANGHLVVAYADELPKNEMITSVKRPGFEFVGWYIADDPYGYGEVLTDITLVAVWRRPGNVRVIYIDNVSDPHGTGFPLDKYIYAVDSSAVVGAVPDSVDEGWAFIGWKIQQDSKNILYYPNNCIGIKEEYLQKNISGYDNTCEYVVLEAQYDAKKGSGVDPEYTTITYHSNNGLDNTVVVLNGAKGLLRVNETVIALSNDTDTKFTRPGYVFKGWSKVPGDNNPLFVLPGGKIAADNDGIPNDLYAIWETSSGEDPPPPYDPPPPPYDPPPSDPPTDPPTTPVATPAGQVLGARRDTGNGAAVLGARRARTEDSTNLALRVLAILAAGAVAAGLLITSKKEDDEQKEEQN